MAQTTVAQKNFAPDTFAPDTFAPNNFFMPKDSLMENILLKTGATRIDLSTLFDTHHSIVGRHLSDSKNLPADVYLQMLELYAILINIKPPKAATPAPVENAELKSKIAWCLAQCSQLKKKLANMEKQYAQGSTMLLLMDAYCKAHPTLTEKKQRCVDSQIFKATRTITLNGWLPQQELRNSIALLEYEAGLYEGV